MVYGCDRWNGCFCCADTGYGECGDDRLLCITNVVGMRKSQGACDCHDKSRCCGACGAITELLCWGRGSGTDRDCGFGSEPDMVYGRQRWNG